MITPRPLEQCKKLFQKKQVMLGELGANAVYYEANPRAKSTVVLVHGLTGSHYSMLALAAEWVERGYRVLVPDLPGHGESDVVEVKDMADLAGWLNVAIEQMHPGKDYTLFGYSFGSHIALAYARRQAKPGQLRLVLSAPIPMTVRPVLHILDRVLARLPDTIARRLYYENHMLEAFRVNYLLTNRNNVSFRRCTAEGIEVEGKFAKHRYASMQLMGASLRANPFQIPLDDWLKSSTVVIYGQRDNVSGAKTPAYMRKWSKGARVIEVEGCGHLLHIEAIEEMTGALEMVYEKTQNLAVPSAR